MGLEWVGEVGESWRKSVNICFADTTLRDWAFPEALFNMPASSTDFNTLSRRRQEFSLFTVDSPSPFRPHL
ncbi:MAG: hypothetical protein KME19_09650 [Microcoleus vaginatus WJT46-NPBG5]|nr:hypothetical protein [Microcoleus vaginatus WJT46-NPBG5]